jgi:hypothetical protein
MMALSAQLQRTAGTVDTSYAFRGRDARSQDCMLIVHH